MLLVVTTAALLLAAVVQPGSLRCGAGLHALHMWLYVEGLLLLAAVLVYVELLIAYFLRSSRDKRLGFLLEKKRSIRRLAHHLLGVFALLVGVLAAELCNYDRLYLCASEAQEAERTRLALALRWTRSAALVFASHRVFRTFASAPRPADAGHEETLIRMDTPAQHLKSFSLKNSEDLDGIF